MTPLVAVVAFPGSNDVEDAALALTHLGAEAAVVWHGDSEFPAGVAGVVLPGGFSYGDYLRCGAIARFSPAMAAVRRFADDGGLVLGICNGFQILCEAGLLPGVLRPNRQLEFVCRDVRVHVERADHLGHHPRVGHALPDELPLVVAPHPLHDDPRDVERERDHLLVGHVPVHELEVALRPEEDVVDRLLGLLLHEAEQVRLGDRVDHDEDPAEEDLRLLLDLHRHFELLLRDVAVRDEEVAEVLALVGGGRRGDAAVREVDALLDAVPVDQEGAGLRAEREPLKQLSQLHRLQIAGDSQGCLEARILT